MFREFAEDEYVKKKFVEVALKGIKSKDQIKAKDTAVEKGYIAVFIIICDDI